MPKNKKKKRNDSTKFYLEYLVSLYVKKDSKEKKEITNSYC